VLGWYADELVEHSASWAGRPLSNPRERASKDRHPCEARSMFISHGGGVEA